MKFIMAALYCSLLGSDLVGGVSALCPIPDRDLADLRKIVAAERIAEGDQVREALEFYMEYTQIPADEIDPERAGRFSRFRVYQEKLNKPAWFSDQRYSGDAPGEIKLAKKIGDEVFSEQKESADTQDVKALCLLCLASAKAGDVSSSHEARDLFPRLLKRTPWDWELHFFYSRFLWEKGERLESWREQRLAAYLNPSPPLWQLQELAQRAEDMIPTEWEKAETMIREVGTDRASIAVVVGALERKHNRTVEADDTK